MEELIGLSTEPYVQKTLKAMVPFTLKNLDERHTTQQREERASG